MEAIKTLTQAIQHFADHENCRRFMVEMRYLDGVVRCPYCGCEKVTYLANAKVYRCYGDHPKQKFSLKVGTVFEDSPIGLDKWLPAVWLLTNCKNGISSYELSRDIGVTQKSAWFMLHRIRLAMQSGTWAKMGGQDFGPVEVDETFIGPKPQKMHLEKRLAMKSAINGDGRQKVSVMGMLDRESRKVRARVVPNVKRETLQREILNGVEKGSKVYTDGWVGYDQLKAQEYIHETVNHLVEYVRGEVHTQGIDNFWSLLKRSLTGTYIAVEPFHLDRYVAEQVFRYNNRSTKDNPLNDADRFALAVSQISGKRLTYAELTGKVGETETQGEAF
ncbi:MAG TPA: IS1595 family transposase [Terracidiphilus sp.]|jgi:transposase-like protein